MDKQNGRKFLSMTNVISDNDFNDFVILELDDLYDFVF
jgi:hypothetical protein